MWGSPLSRSDQGLSEYVLVSHGKLEIRVPMKIFRGTSTRFDEGDRKEFEELLSSRYPWLSEYAVEEILEKTRDRLVERIDSRKSSVEKAREVMENGQHTRALEMIGQRLDSQPEDPDIWYLRGEILCRMGDREEGYRSFHKARALLKDQGHPPK